MASSAYQNPYSPEAQAALARQRGAQGYQDPDVLNAPFTVNQGVAPTATYAQPSGSLAGLRNVASSSGGGGTTASQTAALTAAAEQAKAQRAHDLAMQQASIASQQQMQNTGIRAQQGQQTAQTEAQRQAAGAANTYGTQSAFTENAADERQAAQAAAAQRAESAASLAEREQANNRAREATMAQYRELSGGGGGNTGAGGGMMASEQAARDAAFARAKEQSGQIAQSSLEGLRNSLSRRGITSGGYANQQAAEALAPATDRLQDFTREGLIQDYNRAGQIGDRDAAAGLQREQMANQQKQSLLSLLTAGGKLY